MKKRISRRIFLQKSSVAALAPLLHPRLGVSRPVDDFDLTTSAPAIHEAIFAQTSVGDFLSTTREKEVRELLALGHIHRKANDAIQNPQIRTAALNELRDIAVEGSKVSPKTFDDFSFLLTGTTSESRSRDEQMIRQGFSISSGVLGIINPVVGGVLTVAGSLAELRLGLTTGNEPLLPGVEEEQLRNIAKIALAKGLQKYRSEEAFRAALADPTFKALVKVDFGATTSQLVEKLPTEQKEILKRILGKSLTESRKQNAENKELIKNLTEQVNKQVEKLQDQAESAARLINEIRDQQTKEEERRARQVRVAYINAEINGALVIADVILIHLFGDPRAASILRTTVTTLQSVFNATVQFSENAIGALALTGTYLNGAMALAAMFSAGGPSPEQQILNEMGKLHQHLEVMRVELNRRLDVIERRQIVMLNYLSAILTEMRANHAEVSARLENIKLTLNLQYEASIAVSAEFRRNNLVEQIRQCENNLASRHSRRFSFDTFSRNLAHFSAYATSFSTEIGFAGNFQPPLTAHLLISEKLARRQGPIDVWLTAQNLRVLRVQCWHGTVA